MNSYDHAIQFSLAYLDTIEQHLPIQYDANRRPVCIHEQVTVASTVRLRIALKALIGGPSSVQARDATIAFGNRHIQTLGFGHVSDFDKFVKLGFLYGKRVVLWDVLHSRLLHGAAWIPEQVSAIAQTACNLLLLRPIIEQGGLVILAHPIDWSQRARDVDAALRRDGNESTAVLGLSMALVAIEEGLPLHPYTLSNTASKPIAHDIANTREQEFYSRENYLFHQAITSLLADQRFAWLEGVSAADFYRVVVQHPELEQTLREHFTRDLNGLSAQQVQERIAQQKAELGKLIEKRHQAMKSYAADGVETSLAFAATTATSLADLPVVSLLLAANIAAPLLTATRKWLNPPPRHLLLQVFQELQQQEQREASLPPSLIEPVASIASQTDAEIERHLTEFRRFYWTEEKHHYLESLPADVAVRVLHALDPDDMETIVSFRRHQQDYIGDYLMCIRELAPDSFWAHIAKMFEFDEGILLYDLNEHIEVMCTEDMPMLAWQSLLDSLFHAHEHQMKGRHIGGELEFLPEIIVFQTGDAPLRREKRIAVKEWIKELSADERESALWFFQSIHDDVLPEWLHETTGTQQ